MKLLIKSLVLILTVNGTMTGFCQEEQAKEPVYKNFSFDKTSGIISYELTVPAWVRIRMGIEEGPLYRTICDWEKRGAGRHEEKWDGMDPSGRCKLVGRDDLVFAFNYFTEGDEYLSDVQTFDILPLDTQSVDVQTPGGNNIGMNLPNLKVNEMHKAHQRDNCRDVKVNITLLKDTPQTKDGFYIIDSRIPIEVNLDKNDKVWFRKQRYSTHIFIDDLFVRGEFDGYVPYTWIFDPQKLNEGKHLITVNLAGLKDHYGIGSLPVYIKK